MLIENVCKYSVFYLIVLTNTSKIILRMKGEGRMKNHIIIPEIIWEATRKPEENFLKNSGDTQQ